MIYEYNPLGQLVDKKLHSTNGTNYLQSVDMRYNIRGQLLSINNSARNINTDNNDESNDVFGMEILYDKDENTGLGNTKYYSGMISAIKWSAASPANTDERSFKYSYDNLYRLTLSKYQAKENGVWTKHLDGFNETLSYDENGNILSLQRSAVLNNSITQIDALTYSYKNTDTHNQLENISDAIPTNTTGYGYRNYTGSSNAYMYDDNGNLTTDPKKGTTITYNELNKPTLIQISSTKKVEYRYDAAGNRISKYIYNNSSTVTKSIEYIGGYVIENDILSYYSMAEGRVRNEGGGFGLSMKMEYFITDQQGNTRVSFEDNNGTALLKQENSYYAFGMQMAGGYVPTTNPNKKLYNAGSEWQDDIEGLADYYSTFFREYDPIIGRFNGVDPMSESFESWTTYHYSYNNPVNFNDPRGDRAASSFSSPGELAKYIIMFGINAVEYGTGNNAFTMDFWGQGGGFFIGSEDGNGGNGEKNGGSEGSSGSDKGGNSDASGGEPNQAQGTSIVTTIDGMGQFFFGYTTANRWGFYNISTNAFYSGTNPVILALSATLTDFATSENKIISSRFTQMANDRVMHNIYTAGVLLPTVTDGSGRVTGTNTAFTIGTETNVREDRILSNGVTDYRARFAGGLLSTAFLNARTNVVSGSLQLANGWFDGSGNVRWVQGDRWSQRERNDPSRSFAQSIGRDADRMYIENNTLRRYNKPQRTFYTSNYMNGTGTGFLNRSGTIPLQMYGIFLYTGFHY